MLALDEVRVVEDRGQDHLTHIALHLRIATNSLGQVVGFVGNATVELHQVFKLVFQCSVAFEIVAMDRLDSQLKIGNIVAERFEQLLDRLRVGLTEHAALLLQNIACQVAELLLHNLLQLLLLGTLLLGCHTLLLALLLALLFECSLLIRQTCFESLDTHRTTLRLGLRLALCCGQLDDTLLQLLSTCRLLVCLTTCYLALGRSLGTRQP